MKNIKIISGFLISVLGTSTLLSQTVPAQTKSSDTVSHISGVLVFVLVAVMFILIFVFSKEKYLYIPGERKPSLFKKFRQFVTRSVPIEQEEDIMFDHDFDGIKELDNKIPPWFNFIFYGSIVFAAIYLLNYHVFGTGQIMIDEYLDEVRIANEKREELIKTGALINENNVVQLTDEASLLSGKSIFTVNCVPCHGPDGGGTVGPNLTDKYWIHGGGIKNVFKTIKYGVPVKGMISWQSLLNPKKMQEAGSYILSLQGTNPPTGKPPEGNLYIDTIQTGNDTVKVKADTTKVKKDTTKTPK
jgi:cytochrome c oxidase cbb3-type subunit 3